VASAGTQDGTYVAAAQGIDLAGERHELGLDVSATSSARGVTAWKRSAPMAASMLAPGTQ
jgi:hypothetical protein